METLILAFFLIAISSIIAFLIYKKSKSNIQTGPRIIQFEPLKDGLNLKTSNFSRVSQHFEDLTPILKTQISLKRENVDGIDGQCVYFVRNLLSKEECKMIIEASEKTGFESRKFEGYNKDSSSCVVWSPEFTNAIYERMGKECLYERTYYDSGLGIVLDDINFENQVVKYYGKIDCINPSVRVERYHPGQHLKIHRDGCVRVNEKENIYTVYAIIVYLNDDYEDGYTRFAKNKNPKDPKDLYEFIDVKGKTGDALIFRHEILHTGGYVSSGTKYILRLDAAYCLEN